MSYIPIAFTNIDKSSHHLQVQISTPEKAIEEIDMQERQKLNK